jgi:hypothetical protein
MGYPIRQALQGRIVEPGLKQAELAQRAPLTLRARTIGNHSGGDLDRPGEALAAVAVNMGGEVKHRWSPVLVWTGYPIRVDEVLPSGYPIRMAQRKRTPARIEAEQRYAEKRAKKPVSFRLDDEEMAALDRMRGAKSRADYVLGLVLKAIKRA